MENRLLSTVEKPPLDSSTATISDISSIRTISKHQRIIGKCGAVYFLKNLRVNYNIKTPKHKGRRSFSVVIVYKDQSGKVVKRESLRDTRLSALNSAFQKGCKDFDVALGEVRSVVEEYKAKEKEMRPDPNYCSENLKLVDQYMEKVYRRRKCLDVSKESMKHDLTRAVKLLGPLSVYSASEDDLQDMIDANAKSSSHQRRAVDRLRQLLKFIGSDARLEKVGKDENVVKYLALTELEKLLEFFKEDRVMWCLVCVAGLVGLRMSEIFGLRRHQLKSEDNLFIDTQLLPTGERRLPKNKKKRTAFMLPGAYEAVKEWLEIPQSVKEEYRRGGKKITEAVRAACRELWVNDPEKHLTFRDLRHIVGVFYSENGLSDTQISKFMGNTPEVSRMHYQRFMVSDDEIRLARATLGLKYG